MIALEFSIFQNKFKNFKQQKCYNKNITINIFRIQVSNSMFGCFCIEFIDFMLKGKSLLNYSNLFSPYEYDKNDQIILKYFE